MPPAAPRIGQDLVDLARFRRALERQTAGFARRVFTGAEWALGASVPDQGLHLALCFAAKEAAFKALGSGWGSGVAWRDVELVIGDEEAPRLVLAGAAAALAEAQGLVLSVSLAHSEQAALAQVLGQALD